METESTYGQDLAGAALMVVLGGAVVVAGAGYRIGELTRMGAGYVPVVIGTLMVVIGVLIGLTARRSHGIARAAPGPLTEVGLLPAKPGEGRIQWRGWLCILGGVAAFVVAGGHLGLVPAIFLAVFISACGDRANSLRDCALLAAAITIAGVAIFSYGLKLTFPLFTWA